MSKDKSSDAPQTTVKANKEERSSLVIGILTLIVIVGIFFALLAALGNMRRIGGELTMANDMRLQRGTACTFVYTPEKDVADGTKIVWYANGEEVDSYDYMAGDDLTFDYAPPACGQLNLQARIGDKYTQNAVFWVGAPRLTLTAPTMTIAYGETPDFDFDCSGYVCDDCREDMCYDGCCRLTAEDGTVFDCCNDKPLPVGTYTVDFDKECCYKDYETEYVNGTVTVLPRKLTVDIAKQYDRTTDVDNTQVTLNGVRPGDRVELTFDKAQFIDRNVGNNKQVTLQNMRLTGKDSANYTIDSTSDGKGSISQMTLSELKKYDFGSYFSPRFAGTRIPTMDEFLSLVETSDISVLNIELKSPKENETAIVSETIRLVKEHGLFEKLLISSFDPKLLVEAKQIDETCKTGFLYSVNRKTAIPMLRRSVEVAKELCVDALHPQNVFVNEKYVYEAHEAGLIVNTWTVNSVRDIEKMIRCGVDGIITNYPDVTKGVIEKHSF